MTATEKFKRDLGIIVDKYKPVRILELGVETGKSTKVFLKRPYVELFSVDCVENKELAEELSVYKNWEYVIDDVDNVLDNYMNMDMIFMDITYYEPLNKEYGMPEMHKVSSAGWKRDLPRCWELLNEGGILVISDYMNDVGYRPGPRKELNDFTNGLDKTFEVYPARGGLAVLQK